MYIRTALDSDNLDALVLARGIAHFTLTYADLFDTEKELQAFTAEVGNRVVLIDRALGDPLGRASIADDESFAITDGQLARWYDQREEAGTKFITVYTDRDNLAAADAALGARGHWRWVATLDGTAWLNLPGYRALRRPGLIQCLSSAMTGLPADLSLVLSSGWHPEVQGQTLVNGYAGVLIH